MTKAVSLESIGHAHLPPTILGTLKEYFKDSFSFQATTKCSKIIFWDPKPQEILDYYWENLKGYVLSFSNTLNQPSSLHPCFEYVAIINQPCRFQDLRAALQRKSTHTFWKVGPYLGDFQRRHLIHHTTLQVIELTEKESTMLEYLCQSPNHSIDRENLLKDVWQYNPDLTTHTLETHIYRLRQKLTPHENLLITTETGYMLVL